jgi:cupin superfamily acireductone dioxygenase involved in methionine salvage
MSGEPRRHAVTDAPNQDLKFLLDPYGDWAKGEGVPIVEALGLDLFEVETKPWARWGTDGAIVHLKGRGDFTSLFLLDLQPGGKSAQLKHMFEMVVYVLDGNGSTTIETADGRVHSFEWQPKSLFALPLNAKYQFFNGSGTKRARLACVNAAPIVMNLYHDTDFTWNNAFHFRSRDGEANHFSGEGEFVPIRPGRNMWVTNFVPTVSAFELKAWEARGSGSSNMKFILADGTMHAHSSEMPVGTYKKGHRHGADFYVFTVHGTGYSLLWYDNQKEFERIDWKHGVVFVPPDGMFHQHFNTNPTPARYLAVALGSMRYPFVESKRKLFGGGVDTSVEDGGNQIEYTNQDPRIHEIYLKELAKTGVDSRMGKSIDESRYGALLKKTA